MLLFTFLQCTILTLYDSRFLQSSSSSSSSPLPLSLVSRLKSSFYVSSYAIYVLLTSISALVSSISAPPLPYKTRFNEPTCVIRTYV